jgi:hypothetical protein
MNGRVNQFAHCCALIAQNFEQLFWRFASTWRALGNLPDPNTNCPTWSAVGSPLAEAVCDNPSLELPLLYFDAKLLTSIHKVGELKSPKSLIFYQLRWG